MHNVQDRAACSYFTTFIQLLYNFSTTFLVCVGCRFSLSSRLREDCERISMAFIACARRSPITSNHQSGFGHFPYDVPIWIVVCLVMIHIACCYVWFCSPTRDHSFILTLGLAGLQQQRIRLVWVKTECFGNRISVVPEYRSLWSRSV